MKKTLTIALLLSMFIARLGAQVILQDSFNYPPIGGDTTLTNVSGNLWTNYSGTIDSKVVNGRLEVFGSRAGDVYRPFTNTLTSTVAYASFIVNATNLVNNTNYFAHFSANTTTFKGRVFAAGPGAAPNTWRLGISASGGAGTQVIFPLDLATNVDYRVVISYDTVSFTGTLWIDPTGPSDPNILTTDASTAATLKFFSFRQSGTTTITAPNVDVDDLYVGNSFADVNVGAVKPPTIYYQPPTGPTTNFAGGNLTLSCVAGGAGTLSFQWQHAGTNLLEDANDSGTISNRFSIVSAITNQSGAYQCIVTSTTNSVFAGSVTSVVSQVVISVAPVPPTITTQPSSNSVVYAHQTVKLKVVAIGPPSFSYQWFLNNSPLSDGPNFSGTGGDTLTVSDITTNDGTTGTYRVEVTNPYGTTPSSNAVITAISPPAVSIAYLRSLVDPNTYLPTNSPATIAYQVTGTVTTFTNITTGNTSSYYLQDGTAGINIFVTSGSASTFRPLQGEVVTFVGVLSSFSSGLELVADVTGSTTIPYTSFTDTGTNVALPTPIKIPFTVTNNNFNNVNYLLAGSLVTLTNVYFGTNAGVVLSSTVNQTIAVTNASGQSFNLSFFFVDLDTAGQTLPAFAYSVTGVLYGLHPNFSVGVTHFADIVTTAPLSPIPLNIQLSGGSVILTWADASFNLLSATNVMGPYTAVGSGTGYSEPVTNTAKFFRLLHP